MSAGEKHKYVTIVEALVYHRIHTPHKLAYRYLMNGETEGPTLTYSQLYSEAEKVANKLLLSVKPGERALLLYPQGLDFVVALFGCFLAGVIAVPMHPPTGRRRTDRLENVTKDCSPSIALTIESVGQSAQHWFESHTELAEVQLVYTDVVQPLSPKTLPAIGPNDIALLQYTSGSTGDPKGVEVSHNNLIHNNHELLRAVDYSTEVVCWLPIYHDMGLIGNIIFVVYCGGTLTLMSPLDFVRKPVRWLKAMSHYKATGTGAPNFAYDLCCRYISDHDLQGIDLSSWHATCNGAEPIRPDTIRRFTERFAKAGFRQEVFVPCYGMAEATALVSGGRDSLNIIKLRASELLAGKAVPAAPNSPSNETRELASSGPPAIGMSIAIVSPETRSRCAPDQLGEVWVKGPSVTQGYWQRPELNQEVFEAYILDENGNQLTAEGQWLRTGDIGFLYQDMLYISGRLREMLIINGMNIFPQDIERSVQESHPSLEENAGAVFSVESPEGIELVIAFQEISRNGLNATSYRELFRLISENVMASNEIALAGIYLIAPGRLPKTTSGKIKRKLCAELYASNEIPGLLESWQHIDKNHQNQQNVQEFDRESLDKREVIEFKSHVDAIAYHAENNPDGVACRFLLDGETEYRTLSNKEVYEQAHSLAVDLLKVAKSGDRAILMYPSGLDFIIAFFGCLMAGIIAVPMYPPSGRRRMGRLESVFKDCQPLLALSLSSVSEQARIWFSEIDGLSSVQWMDTDEIVPKSNEQLPKVDPQQVAFLQYTSGSTGDPKGVEVTHANLAHNSYHTAFALTPQRSIVCWLPIYHDMGLIGNVLLAAYLGVPLTLMSPVDFIRKPIRWLRAITKYRPQLSPAPNFAYDLCTQQITDEELEGIDLSSWDSACNGAEPIQAATLKKFQERFAKVGFGKHQFLPCYGLAEATLMVTGKSTCNTPVQVDSDAMLQGKITVVDEKSSPVKKRALVSSGPTLNTIRVEIVDPETMQRAAADTIGEIWIQGDSVAKGYWNRPKLSEEIFRAHILDDQGKPLTEEGTFLRSGDLGFKDKDLLYITGRIKELLIIGGANIYPQDIERTTQESHPHLQENAGAVFSVEAEGETEKVVVFQEIARAHIRDFNAEELFREIGNAVMAYHELAVGAIYLISPGGIPKTTSGKIQRTKCRLAYLDGDVPGVLAHWDLKDVQKKEKVAEPAQPESTPDIANDKAALHKLQKFLIDELAALTNVDAQNIHTQTSFANLGISSIQGIQLAERLSTYLGTEVPVTDLYNYSSVSALSQHVLSGSQVADVKASAVAERPVHESHHNEPIAIVGMSCRFPGADGVDAYWSLLANGKDAVAEVPADRWNKADFFAEKQAPGKMVTKWGGFINDVDMFDAPFFEISPREAESMDPQQRILLQETYKLLESAGYPAQSIRGSKTGVYIGIAGSDYSGMLLRDTEERNIYTATGTSYSIAANRLSYFFDLNGPSVALDTACSSSLVAVHLAVQGLRNAECNMAIAGGVNMVLTPDGTLSFSESGLMASDGHCKTFDAQANGIVRSDGCGVLLLKPLSGAIKDCDQIHAVIRGSAINQDGRSNGLTAPNGLAQEACVRQALGDAQLQSSDVSFVETHGTGTVLGDPIEVNALDAVYGKDRNTPLVLGSVKANIGHLEGAAGVAGMIKAVLSLKHRQVPTQIHFNEPNPQIDWRKVKVVVPKGGHSFDGVTQTLRAGVSSFGFGGTNAHVILEEAPLNVPSVKPTLPVRELQLLPLSAKDKNALRKKLTDLDKHLQTHADIDLNALAYTLSARRDHFKQRSILMGRDAASLRKGIAASLNGEESLYGFDAIKRSGQECIAFLFTGAGPQYPGMGSFMYANEPAFKVAMDACVAEANKYLEKDLKSVIFCTPNSEEHALLNRIDYMQPAVFAFEYSMYKFWESLGVTPDVVIGHSLGELVAACVAGVFDLPSAVKLTVKRGALIYSMPVPGTMASVQASEAEVLQAIGSRSKVSVAVLNSPMQTVVSGEVEEVQAIVDHFDKLGRKTKVLNISRAGHSPLMDPICDAFREVANSFKMQPASIPLISNVTGKAAGNDIATAQYWVDHLRQPVRFYDGLKSMADLGANVLIEVGPNPVLLGISTQANLPQGAVQIASANEEDPKNEVIYTAVAKYYASGGELAWKAYHAERPSILVHTPPYPFSTSRYWMQAKGRKSTSGKPTGQAILGQSMQVAGYMGVFESEVSWSQLPYLKHHQIIDALIAPGSFHIELILEYMAFAKKDYTLRELSIQRPLFVDETDARKVQVLVEKQDLSDALSVKVFSTDSAGGEWTLHVSGSLQPRKTLTQDQSVDIAALKSKYTTSADVTKFYRDLAAIGFHYGASFQGVQELRSAGRSVLGHLSISPEGETPDQSAAYVLHPALLDSAFQLLMAASIDGDQRDTYLPFAVEQLNLLTPHLNSCWAELTVADAAAGADILSCDIRLYSDEGAFAGSLKFSCKKASPDQIVSAGNRLRTDWLYDARWVPLKSAPAAEQLPKNLLIVCNDEVSERYDGFLSEIKSRGIPHTVASDWGLAKAMLFNADFDALAVIWHTDPDADSVSYSAWDAALQGLQLSQDLISMAAAKGPRFLKRIFWITEGFASGNINVATAPLWGVGRTFARETNFDFTLADVDLNTFGSEDIVKAIFSAASENQLRLAEGQTQALRLTRHRLGDKAQTTLTAGSTYLITGGTGDLGLQAARWMAEHTDIAHLLLWARRAPSAEATTAIKTIEALGKKVTVQSVDVGDFDAVKSALNALPAGMPLKGILHIAGLADDALIPEQTEEKFEKVLKPKIFGAWNLHKATEGIQLEVFAMYSSLSAMAGVPGVSNYAAGNAFLDALAHHRRAQGLAASSINWGAWATATGLLDASRVDDFRQYMRARGVDLIEGEAGVDILGYILTHAAIGAQILVAPLLLNSTAPFELPSGELQPLYRDLFNAQGDEPVEVDAKSDIRRTIYLAKPEDRHAILAAEIKKQVGLVIRHEDPDSIDPDADLFSLGIDSLMAAEMVNRLSKIVKEPLAPTIIFDQRTVNELTTFLLEVTIEFTAEDEKQAPPKVSIESVQRSVSPPVVESKSPSQQTSNGAATEDWDALLKRVLTAEMKSRGHDPSNLHESWTLRRSLARLASALEKKAK